MRVAQWRKGDAMREHDEEADEEEKLRKQQWKQQHVNRKRKQKLDKYKEKGGRLLACKQKSGTREVTTT